MTLCVYCHEPVDPDSRTTRRRVFGWESKRRQGGTNHLELRTVTGEFACHDCIEALLAGRHPAQMEMLTRGSRG